MGHSEQFERARLDTELRGLAGGSAPSPADALERDIRTAERAARVRAGLLAYNPYQALNQRLKSRVA